MLKRPALGFLAAATVLAPALMLSTVVPAGAAPAPGTCDLFFDINHDTHDDVAIGTPGEDVGLNANAGTVTVAYGDADGAITGFDGRSISLADLEMTPHAGDRFGATVLTADLNGDHCGDLVIGAPGRSSGAGIVVIIYGQPPGTGQFGKLVQVLAQGKRGAPDKVEAGDGFGSTLAVTGSNASGGPTQLWVGAPMEDLGSAANAGQVTVFPTATGAILPTTGITLRQQGSAGFGGVPETGDRFGAALAGSKTTVLVGVPGEDLGTSKDAGQFYSVVGGVASGRSQGSGGTPGQVENGDQLGASLALLPSCLPGVETWAIGSPYEKIGAVAAAGTVTLMDRGTGTSLVLAQGKSGIPEQQEANDRFGERLLATPATANQPALLAIGIPHENLGSVADAGAVTTLASCSGSTLAATSVSWWTQNTTGIGSTPKAGELFGSSLGAVELRKGTVMSGSLVLRLLIGVPGEDELTQNGPLINAGMVAVLPESTGGFTATGSLLIGQTTGGMPGLGETNDSFGSALDTANASR